MNWSQKGTQSAPERLVLWSAANSSELSPIYAAGRAFRLPARFLRRITLYVFGTYVSRGVRSLPRHLSRKAGYHLRDQRGFNLIEVIVAVGILALVGPGILMSISTSNRTIQRLDEQTQAEALARVQIETIKGSSYLDCNPSPCYSVITDVPGQYTVSFDVEIVDTVTCSDDGNCNTLQKVTASVFRPTGDGGNRPVFTVSTYKMKR